MEMHDHSVATVIYTSIGDSSMPKEHIEISGGAKTAVIDDFKSMELWSGGKCQRKSWSRQDKGQAQEIDEWVKSLGKGTVPIPFEEIVNVHRACFAAIRSIQNRAPVKV
jgi:polar amino acid transport system substrate-binding protein